MQSVTRHDNGTVTFDVPLPERFTRVRVAVNDCTTLPLDLYTLAGHDRHYTVLPRKGTWVSLVDARVLVAVELPPVPGASVTVEEPDNNRTLTDTFLDDDVLYFRGSARRYDIVVRLPDFHDRVLSIDCSSVQPYTVCARKFSVQDFVAAPNQ